MWQSHPFRSGSQRSLRAGGFVTVLLGLVLCAVSALASAQQDPPGRVGRLADFNGSVSWWDDQAGEWAAADRNRPLTGGDRVSTAASGRAELRIGSTVLRLSNNTEIEVLRLDDERVSVQLHSGSVALRVRSREVADEVEVVTAEAVLRPLSAGHFRIDRIDDATRAGSWRGELRIDDPAGFVVAAGQAVELHWAPRGDARPGELRSASQPLANDGFATWVATEDRQDERTASNRYVSPEMTGAEDLDRAGRWEQHPEYGPIWTPLAVAADWAPYRYGHWAWVAPWGWTWVDDAPWGFAPFHYGRWVAWHGGWGWVPGAYVARPVYAPALVAWVGGGSSSSWGISLQIGGGLAVGWVPLSPREPYQPYYRVSPRYVERVNPPPPWRWQHPPGRPPRGPMQYGNQGAPGGLSVVPRDALLHRQPVPRALIDLRPDRGGGDRRGPQMRQGQQPIVAGGEPPPAPPGASATRRQQRSDRGPSGGARGGDVQGATPTRPSPEPQRPGQPTQPQRPGASPQAEAPRPGQAGQQQRPSPPAQPAVQPQQQPQQLQRPQTRQMPQTPPQAQPQSPQPGADRDRRPGGRGEPPRGRDAERGASEPPAARPADRTTDDRRAPRADDRAAAQRPQPERRGGGDRVVPAPPAAAPQPAPAAPQRQEPARERPAQQQQQSAAPQAQPAPQPPQREHDDDRGGNKRRPAEPRDREAVR